MTDIESEMRRKLLLGSGALAVQACLPMSKALAAGPPSTALLNRHAKKRYRASVIKNVKNPYFLRQGGPKSGSERPHAPRTGPGLRPHATRFARIGAPKAGYAAAALTPVSWRRWGTPRLSAGAHVTLAQATSLGQASTLVLYDTTGQWGWLGEIYGIMVANLASHFGSWKAMPVASYTAGMLNSYTACIYIGSTYGEPVPQAFLNDVYAATSTNIIWIYDNIWQLASANPGFATKYGFMPYVFDFSSVAEVTYGSHALTRYSANGAGIMTYSTLAPPATVLAQAVRSDSTTFPWAVRSGNLTYIGEIPLAYVSEGDRYLILCDLLFDALAPTTATQHLAMVRFEDLNPASDPTAAQNAAQYLYSNGIPFSFHISARYVDPNGVYSGGVAQDISLSSQPAMISAIQYMEQHGGVMINHGYTHQYSNVDNPYTAVTGDDCEFYRITSNNGVLTYAGPLPPDTSSSYALGRFSSYQTEISAAGLQMPTIVTFPDYAASVPDFQAAAQTFPVRAERSFYFPGLLSGQPIDYSRVVGQYFPYSVFDVYGSKVLADTLGGIDPTTYMNIPPRLPADIIAAAQRTLAVRSGVASFFYNPEDPLTYLQQTVQGILGLGYTFVSPLSL
jgi:uncharacterized protein YdaL